MVWSAGSGLATRIPVIWRPSLAALTATRASCSAVAAPADTASTVTLARIVSATRGSWASTTQVTTVSGASGGLASRPRTPARSRPDRHDRASGGPEHAVRSIAVAFSSCCGPSTNTVGIPSDAPYAASCGPSASAWRSDDSDTTATDTPGPRASITPR